MRINPMKTTLIAVLALSAATLIGCASTTPTKLEQKLFDIQTNIVEVVKTNTVFKTNYVVQTVQNIIPLPTGSVTNYTVITNAVAVPIQLPATNYIESYAFKPNETAATIQTTGGMIGSFFGAGGLVTTLLGGIFSAWAAWRSRKNGQTAVALSQIIETGSEVLKSLPQGAAYDAAWKSWMQAHQAETGTIQNVLKILQNVTDNSTAQKAAKEISETIGVIQSASAPKT